jgi:hypothetical protein
VSNSNWITVTDAGSGMGIDSVSFSVAQNTTGSNRTGTLTIAGATLTVTQLGSGATCSATVSPSSQSFGPLSGAGSITVTAPVGCPWTAVSGAPWITVTGAAGTGNGTATYLVASNTGTTGRTGTITIAGSTVTVTQSAPCSYTVSPTSLMLSGSPATGTVTVTTQVGCNWSALSTTSWFTFTGSGTASGTATYTIAPNSTATSRSAVVFVGGQQLSVIQAPATKPVSPTSLRIVK